MSIEVIEAYEAAKLYTKAHLLAAYALAALLGLVGLFGGYFFWRHRIYEEGFQACTDKIAAATAAANQRAEDAEREVERMRIELDAEHAANKSERLQAKSNVQRIIHENPKFAVVARPAELHAQRLRELAAVRRSATGH